MFVKKRAYYLFNNKQKSFEKIFHYNFFIREKIERTNKLFPLEKINAIFQKYQKNDYPSFINSKLKKLFWDNATPGIKKALLFSYHRYITNKDNKVANTQIENWLNIPFFKKYKKNLFHCLKLNNFDPIKYIGTKTGKHKSSLRFENIHLSMDKINRESFYTIHWDKYFPKCSISWFKHLLLDDPLS
jgi:hypothetical protein